MYVLPIRNHKNLIFKSEKNIHDSSIEKEKKTTYIVCSLMKIAKIVRTENDLSFRNFETRMVGPNKSISTFS